MHARNKQQPCALQTPAQHPWAWSVRSSQTYLCLVKQLSNCQSNIASSSRVSCHINNSSHRVPYLCTAICFHPRFTSMLVPLHSARACFLPACCLCNSQILTHRSIKAPPTNVGHVSSHPGHTLRLPMPPTSLVAHTLQLLSTARTVLPHRQTSPFSVGAPALSTHDEISVSLLPHTSSAAPQSSPTPHQITEDTTSVELRIPTRLLLVGQ